MWIRKRLVLETIKSKEESESWKSLLMTLNEAVVVCDSTRILFANSALLSFVGADSLADYSTVLPAVDGFLASHSVRGGSGQLFSGKGVLELAACLENGNFCMLGSDSETEVKYYLTVKRVQFNDVQYTLFLMRDSTDAEKVHRTLVEQKYRGALLSTVTHEFRTPLMIIRGNLELIQKESGDTPTVQAALIATVALKYFLRDISVLSPDV